MFFGLVFEETSKLVELPSMEFLVLRRTPVPRVAVLVFADVAKIANCYLPYIFFDTPLNDLFREGVEEVVFASGEFCWAFRARFDGPSSPSVWYPSRVK